MGSIFQTLLCVLIVYWACILYRRWSVYSRTRQFVLDQRRKAGIPDTDHRPLAVAAADAAARRRAAMEQRLRESDDVFRPTALTAQNARHRENPSSPATFRPIPVPKPIAVSSIPSVTRHLHQSKPHRRMWPEPETFYGPTVPSRTTSSSHVSSTLKPRKRDADEITDAGDHDQARPVSSRRVRRKMSLEGPCRPENHQSVVVSDDDEGDLEAMDEDDVADTSTTSYDEESDLREDMKDEEMSSGSASLSSSSMEEDDLDNRDEVDVSESDEVMAPPAGFNKRSSSALKRPADTSDDHGPGDEWTDANGLRWRIGDDGIPRRAVMLIEMKPKYAMPRDTVHPDARARVPMQIERFLSHDEYEEAKRKKQLSWQHELSHAKGSVSTSSSPPSFRSDDVEDSMASIVARRSRGQARRRGANDLLFSDLTRSRRSSLSGGDDSMSNVSMGDASADDSASFSSSLLGDQADMSRRLRLSRASASPARRTASPARAVPLMRQRYARIYGASPRSQSPARTSLDQEAKRKREKRLMSRLHAERDEAANHTSSGTIS